MDACEPAHATTPPPPTRCTRRCSACSSLNSSSSSTAPLPPLLPVPAGLLSVRAAEPPPPTPPPLLPLPLPPPLPLLLLPLPLLLMLFMLARTAEEKGEPVPLLLADTTLFCADAATPAAYATGSAGAEGTWRMPVVVCVE
eukprot:1159915-Pelagomonas_calceolata.AAC.2